MESAGLPITRQLIEVYQHYRSSVVALESVDPALVYRYGVMGGDLMEKQIYKVNEFVEKPDPDDAPSNLVIAGRYVFTPEIFDYLKIIPPGKNNEIQLTDAMAVMLKSQAMYGLHFEGKRHDIGNTLDFIKSNVLFGLKRADLSEQLQAWIAELAKSFSKEKAPYT